jgi:hypothetical protein
MIVPTAKHSHSHSPQTNLFLPEVPILQHVNLPFGRSNPQTFLNFPASLWCGSHNQPLSNRLSPVVLVGALLCRCANVAERPGAQLDPTPNQHLANLADPGRGSGPSQAVT